MYKVTDNNGTVLQRFESSEKAIQYYNNNSDICSNIEPRPSDSDYKLYDSNYLAATVEKTSATLLNLTKCEVTGTTTALPSAEVTVAPTAAEALKLIEAKNVRKYGKQLKRLIDEIIEADGTTTAPQNTPPYVLNKLLQLGYTVKPVGNNISISVYKITEVIMPPGRSK